MLNVAILVHLIVLLVTLIVAVASETPTNYTLITELPLTSSTLSLGDTIPHLLDYVFHPPRFTAEDSPFQQGRQGEIWRARRTGSSTSSSTSSFSFILKKMYISSSPTILDAGRREIHHANRVNNFYDNNIDDRRIVRFVEHFFTYDDDPSNRNKPTFLWLVYVEHGKSLREFLYDAKIVDGGAIMMVPSEFWKQLRFNANDMPSTTTLNAVAISSTTNANANANANAKREQPTKTAASLLMQKVLFQIITGAAHLQNLGVHHRDIKPSNILCKFSTPSSNAGLHDRVDCVLGDLSSGIDSVSETSYYKSSRGGQPGIGEVTSEYAPPEVLFDNFNYGGEGEYNWDGYDSWSIGVVALEIMLGTPNVFTVDQRTTTMLRRKLERDHKPIDHKQIDEDLWQKTLYLAALSDFCLYDPSYDDEDEDEDEDENEDENEDDAAPLQIVKSCNLEDFKLALLQRDTLQLGFASAASDELLNLIFHLLKFAPSDRMRPSEALKHPYFDSLNGRGYLEVAVSPSPSPSPSTYINVDVDVDVDLNVDDKNKALISKTYDFNPTTINDITHNLTFTCGCNRTFDKYDACLQHSHARKHGRFCSYDRSQLPSCLSGHRMLPYDSDSGYCDIKGRRRVVEDFHSIIHSFAFDFYGVFDGHNGNLCSKYSASKLHRVMQKHLGGGVGTDEDIKDRVKEAFAEHDSNFLSRHGSTDKSGSTATSVVKLDNAITNEKTIVIANIGDSSALLFKIDRQKNLISFDRLTVDHTGNNEEEAARVVGLGGEIKSKGGGSVLRVNGSLAVTRSFGDAALKRFVTSEPDVTVLRRGIDGGEVDNEEYIVVASDGLWDVMGEEDVVAMAIDSIESVDGNIETLQQAAERITIEALVRGTTDNVGVLLMRV